MHARPSPVHQFPARRSLPLALVAGGLMALSGCGRDGPERVVVSGTVTYQGAPVQRGIIRFMPAENTRMPMAGGYIMDGHYEIEAKGGVPVGTYTVRIEGYRQPAARPASQAPDALGARSEQGFQEQYLPTKYNLRSELRVEVRAANGAMVRDFAL